jgi:hypothetical protein
MDGYHRQLEPRFGQAITVFRTVISRISERIVVDTGKKTVGGTEAKPKSHNIPIFRTDEDHGNYKILENCSLKAGDKV